MSFYDYNTSRDRGEDENLPSICKAVKSLEEATKATYSAEAQIERAFLLGLWYKNFPEYTLEHLEKGYIWNHMELMPEGAEQYADPYKHLLKFSFISNTGDSWHQCYRDFRERGWQRAKVHRDGGRLQYLLELKGEDKPKGFSEIHLILDISISTCKQIQVGTEMKEVPVMKTVCEDLIELAEEGPGAEDGPEFEGFAERAGTGGEVIPLVVVDDIEELQRRRSGEDTNTEEQKPLSYQDYVHF